MSVTGLPSLDCHADTFLHAKSNSKTRVSFRIGGTKNSRNNYYPNVNDCNRTSLKKNNQPKSVIEKLAALRSFYLHAAEMNFRKKEKTKTTTSV